MKYRQALVFSYQRFENALISIISIRSLTRITPILNFPILSQKRDLVGTFKCCFKNSLPNWRDLFRENRFFLSGAGWQRLSKSFGSRIISNITCEIHAICLNALMVTSRNLLPYTNSFQINTIIPQHPPAFLSSLTCLRNATQNSTASSQRCSLFGSLE